MPHPFSIQKLHQLTGHEAAIFALCPSFTKGKILSGAGDGWVVEWDMANPDLGRLVAKVETQIFSLAALPEYRRIVVGDMQGGVHWVEVEDPDATRNIAHHGKGVFAILPVGPHVFTVGGEGRLTRWSAAEGKSLESLQLSNQSLRCVDYSPDRKELAVGGSDNTIYLLDVDTLDIRHRITPAHANSVFSVRYAPDGRYLLSGSRDAHLNAWSLEGIPRLISSQSAHWYTINAIEFHPKGHVFATASRDKTIKIWDAHDFQLLKVLDTVRDQGHLRSVNALHWMAGSGRLVSAGDDRSLIIWGE
ncbi:MAG: WD40 repeat domain-containing protein [Saprospirales bacterium]|nr:WD40 repeat domain-containing protein [Saprospirales bacterium]